MRAFEFLREEDMVGTGVAQLPSGEEIKITVPVTINMDAASGSGKQGPTNIARTGAKPGQINTTIAEPATTEFLEEPIWIPPGQQSLELQKQAGGKTSPVINQIIKSDNGPGSDPSDGIFAEFEDEGTAEADPRSIYNDCALEPGK